VAIRDDSQQRRPTAAVAAATPAPPTRTGPPAIAYISWVALALVTTASVASLRAAPTMAVYETAPGSGALRLLDWADGTAPYAAAAPMLRPDGRYAGELARLATAGAGADAAYEQIGGVRSAGRKETEVAVDLAALLREHGHSQVDSTVVGSGPNGANPHHTGDRTISAGDPVVLDFGGLAGGYGDYFIHRTGHGIGLTTHEPPYLVEGETHELVPGTCLSIEPGVYLPGELGVRIEDIVTVTDESGRRLNNPGHELRTVA
jgi:hypothetical protein